jgi:transcriptional regulator with XRE-family HTH domain
MDETTVREARKRKKWTQQDAARALGITQAYLSMIESGHRRLSPSFVRRAYRVLNLPPTVLPLHPGGKATLSPSPLDYASELGALGYPGFSYLQTKPKRNPAQVLLEALNEPDLDARVTEGLPWLIFKYSDMDWTWLLRNAKLCDRQNRLGFALALASEAAERNSNDTLKGELQRPLEALESARLAREDTFCRDSMTRAERVWLREHRSQAAAHWNLLTDLNGEHLARTFY